MGIYAIALGGPLAVAVAGEVLPEVAVGHEGLLPLLAVVLLAARYGGIRPGLVSTAVGAVVGQYLLPPSHSFAVLDPSELVWIVAFLGVGAYASLVCEQLHAARRRAEEQERAVEREIAERRNAEVAAREAAASLRVALEAGRMGTWSWDPKNDQVSGSAAPDGPPAATLADFLAAVHPDDRDRVHAAIDASGRGDDHRVEYRVLEADRSVRWIEGRAGPRFAPGGGIDGVAAVCLDVTERKRAEEGLAAQARLLELTHDAILVRDAEDRVTYWNRGAEELYGWSRDEAAGRVTHDLLQTRFPAPLAEVRASLHQHGRWDGDLEHVRKDGRTITVASRWALDPGDEPAQHRILEINHDVSARRAAVTALTEADQRKDEFLATLAHELRNPLAPMRTGLAILERTAVDEQTTAVLAAMERQILQLVRIVDDLLDTSRVSRGRLELRPERVELSRVLAVAEETARPLVDARRHRLEVDLPAGSVFLEADPVRLAQVFANLLNNAAKYTDPGGTIRVRAEVGDDVVVTVSDDGIGIAPEHLPHLFEMFSQAEPALNRSQGGLGIGLALARGIVALHGGALSATSDGPGRGSTFTVRLPRAEPAIAAAPVACLPPRDAQKLRVLVVDDLEDSATTLGMWIAGEGHEVRIAHDGLEALSTAEAFRPEVVLLDIGMPGMNGYEVARRLRTRPWGHEVVLVALTGWGQEQDRCRAAEAGFDRHLTKPIDPEALDALLAKPSPADGASMAG